MIQAYAFLAVFAVQIVVVSVLHPVWFARYIRAKAAAQFPDWDSRSRERILNLYRVVNAGIAVIGAALLVWLFNHMQGTGWNIVPVAHLLSGYSVAQLLPFILASLVGGWIKRKVLLRTPPQTKRTASLQRRGLFDIVSPLTVFLTGLAYVLFAGLILVIQQHPVPGFAGYHLLRFATLAYVWNAGLVYWLLYRRKKWPLETPAFRMQAVEVQVRIVFYVTIAAIMFLSLITTLSLLHLARWVPFATSAYLVTIMLCLAMMLIVLRRQAEADRLVS